MLHKSFNMTEDMLMDRGMLRMLAVNGEAAGDWKERARQRGRARAREEGRI